jgi:hypothetical protein
LKIIGENKMSIKFLVTYEVPYEVVSEEFDDFSEALAWGLRGDYDAKISVILGRCMDVLDFVGLVEFDDWIPVLDSFLEK